MDNMNVCTKEGGARLLPSLSVTTALQNEVSRAFNALKSCACLSALLAVAFSISAQPLSIHPENPHYFQYKGKPTIIITSGEHYGAVLNLDFDYKKYLETLAVDSLNNTRVFAGSYVEPQGAFNIARNTLAPEKDKFIAPWARSSTPGYPNGGNKFDLSKWDDKYFTRLKDFMTEADKNGVIVEMNLFCPFYEDSQWKLSPQNAANNINNVGNVPRTNVYTLDKHGGLLAIHEAMTKKIVTELNQFDNLYYEICNEPYFGGVTLEWQHHIAEVIAETERTLPKKHLISRNVANGSAKIDKTHPAVTVYNFHYAFPPNAVAENYHLNKPIGDNETGFRGTNDLPYRVEAWSFVLAGGALYNNLDYSFVAGHEDGTFVYPSSQPGGGNPVFRKQLGILRKFINSFDFARMKPDDRVIKAGLPKNYRAYSLAKPGEAYAIYIAPPLENKTPSPTDLRPLKMNLEITIPAGRYELEYLNPVTGKAFPKQTITTSGEPFRAIVMDDVIREDLAISIRKK
jgi:hypothetical protein